MYIPSVAYILLPAHYYSTISTVLLWSFCAIPTKCDLFVHHVLCVTRRPFVMCNVYACRIVIANSFWLNQSNCDCAPTFHQQKILCARSAVSMVPCCVCVCVQKRNMAKMCAPIDCLCVCVCVSCVCMCQQTLYSATQRPTAIDVAFNVWRDWMPPTHNDTTLTLGGGYIVFE